MEKSAIYFYVFFALFTPLKSRLERVLIRKVVGIHKLIENVKP